MHTTFEHTEQAKNTLLHIRQCKALLIEANKSNLFHLQYISTGTAKQICKSKLFLKSVLCNAYVSHPENTAPGIGEF